MTKDKPAKTTSRDALGKSDIPALMTLLASKNGVLRTKARAGWSRSASPRWKRWKPG